MQMTLFWSITAAMLLVALALLAPSLLRSRRSDQLDRGRQNVLIARERLEELEADLNSGRVTQAQYEQTKVELEQALIFDLDTENVDEPAQRETGPGRMTLAVIAVALPLFTLPLYFTLGSPVLIQPDSPSQTAGGKGPHNESNLPSVEQMLATLVNRLKENPADTDGWYLLGRTYMAMEDYSNAAATFEKMHQLVGDHAVVLLSWADAQSMAQGGNLEGKPAELVRKAIELDPTNTTGLWLAGMVEDQAGNHGKAIEYWERLAPLIEKDPKSSSRIASLIEIARAKAGLPAPVSGESKDRTALNRLQVLVKLAPELAGKAAPDQSLFIYARALKGPKMPLAAARHKVSDLPLEVTLDDSSAMMPKLKLSNFEQVLVGARISSSGNPIAASGDLTGEVSPVMVTGGEQVQVVIDSVVP